MRLKSKTVVMSGIAAGVAGAATYYLRDQSNRIKLKDSITYFSTKLKDQTMKMRNTGDIPIEKGGNPHPEEIEDNKMVSEGAQYSVDYYNKQKQ